MKKTQLESIVHRIVVWGATVWVAAGSGRAQDEIVIRRTAWQLNERPLPVAVTGFTGEAEKVIKFDLEVLGCQIVDPDQAQFLVTGRNQDRVEGRLIDQVSKAELLAKAYSGATLRVQAHAFVNDITPFLPNRGKGITLTKIAFRVSRGGASEIYVSDFDGYNPRQVTHDNSIVAAPAWVPGQFALYYVSYKGGGPDIYYHDLANGVRRAFARFGGSNMSPAVSPDGTKVAMILSKDGWTDLYVGSSTGGEPVRLTRSPQDESAPTWSPDGQWVCFAGKPREHRQLCKVSPTGGEVQSIRTGGVPNPTEPCWSPDGRWIAFTSQTRAGFDICVVPATGGTATVLVSGEDPCWAPNSRTIVFTRRSGGQSKLYLLDVPTKQVKDIAKLVDGEYSQPAWSR